MKTIPLQGTLETFGLSEILQLVSQQGKTGTLELRTADGVARLRFLEGRLVEAWPDHRSPSERIGALLVRAGLITGAQLDRALDEQIESLRPLGDLLLRMGALRIAEFQDILALQHRETMYKLLRLKRGSFQFVSEPVEIEEGVSTPLDVGALLMEGFRQIDEWPKVLERVPSDKVVYERIVSEDPDDLTAEEALVLGLVDGCVSVREIIDRARSGDFAGWEVLARLWDRGLIAPVERTRPPAEPQPRAKGLPLQDLLLAGLLLVAALGLVLSTLWTRPGGVGPGSAIGQARQEASLLRGRAAAWAARGPAAWPPLLRSR